ncbi:hypothetical protein MUK42_05574 [Musa troglodytarum]|uniref:Uncharacterized protein n=2 Tax=Musa troglodytarum TaxID=320322 RepID=A0A9E7JL14_9LILI|nr:hypothetical protein MUK42_05574 [Musa troglodytarum]
MPISATADLPLTRQRDSNGGATVYLIPDSPTQADETFKDTGNGYAHSSWVVNAAGSVGGERDRSFEPSDLETAPRQYSFHLSCDITAAVAAAAGKVGTRYEGPLARASARGWGLGRGLEKAVAKKAEVFGRLLRRFHVSVWRSQLENELMREFNSIRFSLVGAKEKLLPNPEGKTMLTASLWRPVRLFICASSRRPTHGTRDLCREAHHGSNIERTMGEGKWHLKIICSRVFNEYAGNKTLMALDQFHVATLRVFDSLNKNLLGPHKQPPSASAIADKEKEYRKTKSEIDENEFYETILEWTSKDLRIYMANKIVLACLASPALTITTKNVGKRVPRIGPVVEKIPAPVLFSVYSALLVFIPDIRVG